MKLDIRYHELELLEDQELQVIRRDGSMENAEEGILREHLMEVFVNGQLTMKLVCIPQYLELLVLGRMFTENMIHSADEVESIYVCRYGNTAMVELKERERRDTASYVETTPTCCTGNRVLNDFFGYGEEPQPVEPIPWKASWIFDRADDFAKGMPLHSQTFATHSALLAQGDQLLFSCEDIGRHNALDKAIGFALMQGIDLKKCLVYSSGRIPTDMAMKAIRAGIPILASKASPSVEAIELAKQFRLTLLCAARRDRMKQFSGPAPEKESQMSGKPDLNIQIKKTGGGRR